MSLLDRIVPPAALRWGALTTEPFDWHIAQLRYAFAKAHEVIWAPFSPLFADIANVIADAASSFPDIFPIATEAVRPDPAALWGEHDRRAEDRP